MVTVELEQEIDIEKFQANLGDSGLVKPKISKSLGVLTTTHGEKKVLIFNTGRITIREASGEKEALEIIDLIKGILKRM